MWDTEYRDENKSRYMVYQAKDDVVIKVIFGRYNRPSEVHFTFHEGKVTIEGNATFEKSVWKGLHKTSETRYYSVFSHTIPLKVAVDTEGAKAIPGEDTWSLVIPRQKPDKE